MQLCRKPMLVILDKPYSFLLILTAKYLSFTLIQMNVFQLRGKCAGDERQPFLSDQPSLARPRHTCSLRAKPAPNVKYTPPYTTASMFLCPAL